MRHAVKLYSVREVLESTGISRRTLRVYEEYGLVIPASGEGRRRFYPAETVETVLRIQRIRDDLGINLPGVQVILDMRRRIEELQQELEEVIQFVRVDLRQELEQYLRREEKAVLPEPLSRLSSPIRED